MRKKGEGREGRGESEEDERRIRTEVVGIVDVGPVLEDGMDPAVADSDALERKLDPGATIEEGI